MAEHTPEIERGAKAIYDLMPYEGKGAVGTKPPWTDKGNGLKQEEARRYCIAALDASAHHELQEALEDQVSRCALCGGSRKVNTYGDEEEIGCSPGSANIKCPDCSKSLEALAKSRGQS